MFLHSDWYTAQQTVFNSVTEIVTIYTDGFVAYFVAYVETAPAFRNQFFSLMPAITMSFFSYSFRQGYQST